MKVTIKREARYTAHPWLWEVRGDHGFYDCYWAETEEEAEAQAKARIDAEVESRNTPIREFTYGPD